VFTLHGDARVLLTEADQLRIRSRAGRKALDGHMQALEQVRLAGPVRPNGKNDARLEVELEERVGAIVPERERPNDQPAEGVACDAASRTRGPCSRVRLNWPVDTCGSAYPAKRIGMIR
jgi:hypothetical protein